MKHLMKVIPMSDLFVDEPDYVNNGGEDCPDCSVPMPNDYSCGNIEAAPIDPAFTPIEAPKYGKEQMIKELMDLPQMIRNQTIKVQNAEWELAELKTAIKAYEFAKYNEVEAEGKEKWSSKEKREAETNSRLGKDENYQVQVKQAEKDKVSLDDMRLDLEYMNNRFKALRSVSLIMSGV